MYSPVKELALRLLKAPRRPPDAPAGSHDTMQVFRASPRYLIYRLLGFGVLALVLTTVLLVLYVVALTEQEMAPLVLAVILTPLLATAVFVGYFLVRIDYDMRYYIVTDRSVRIREGAWTVKEMTLTHANVQNLRIVQGPLERLFGIRNLKLYTAGGGGAASAQGHQVTDAHAAQMAGVENAREVRDLVLSHLRRHADGTGLGDPDDLAARTAAAGTSAEMVAALSELKEATARLRMTAEGLGQD